MEQYITWLQQQAQHFEYGNEIENKIRDQIISSCLLSKLRKQPLILKWRTRIKKKYKV